MRVFTIITLFILSSIQSFALNKDSLYTSLKNYDYKKIDSIMVECPKNIKSFNTVCKYIKKHTKNDQEKSRAIFLWIIENIEYDWEYYKHGSAPYDPDSTFKKRIGVCQAYAELYTKFCDNFNIKSEVVVGYAKSNDTFLQSHAWNIVYLYDTPFLIETTWADRYKTYDNSENKFENFISYSIDFYFLANPKHTHFPCIFYKSRVNYTEVLKDKTENKFIKIMYPTYERQLLERSITFEAFISTNIYHAGYFRYNKDGVYEIKGIYNYVDLDMNHFYKINVKNFKENDIFFDSKFGETGSIDTGFFKKLPSIPMNKIFVK